MGAVAVVLGLAWLVTAGYLVVVLRQISSVRRRLEERAAQERHRDVPMALVVPPLERLTARVDESLRAAGEATARTRREERRIRSFIADISHDLRTPLTSVRGYLQLLQRTELDADQRQKVEVAHRQVSELGELVDRLYEYTYLLDAEPHLELERVDVGVLAAELLLGMAEPIQEAGLEVRFDPPPGVMVVSDHEKLSRIVQNLLRNAVQHGEGTLRMDVSATDGGAAARVTNGVAEGAEVDPARMFDRFYSTGPASTGRTSGLGLSIVRALAEQLGGEVAAEHDPSAATVTIIVQVPDGGPQRARRAG